MSEEKNGEEIVTMVDVLNEEEQLEENAQAVLGASDHCNCTYSNGYVKRMALYSCKTCLPDENTKGGFCLACSYKCHEGHTIIELYTKRNFRCDCGNQKFPNNKCTLVPLKDDENKENSYNQNFNGLYCVCHRPYPDPEISDNDEMIQCVICEDWYHSSHLNVTKPPAEYDEMVCHLCMEKYHFLNNYIGASIQIVENEPKTDLINVVDDGKTEVNQVEINLSNKKTNQSNEDSNVKNENLTNGKFTNGSNEQTNLNDSEMKQAGECIMPKTNKNSIKSATFWPQKWRQQLCKCENCFQMYKDFKLSFLLDAEDTILFYEEQSKSVPKSSQYEAGMEALSSLDRIQQVEAIHQYNNMKEELKEYLKKFAENKKVVREEDIKEFFSQMQARKKQRTDSTSIPYFCR